MAAKSREPDAAAHDASRRVLALVGPTAVGKTSLAIALAGRFDGEIVSLDSRQLYRGLDIGTAKPTPAQRDAVPHHLVDVAAPDAPLALPDVQDRAYAAIDAILGRGRLPILAGGTGQYVRAVVEGWEIPRVAPDPALRARLRARAERQGHEVLHERLAAVDPVSAERIDARNVRRVVRALEVYEHAGEPISAIQSRSAPPYDVHIVGLTRPREALYARIDRRIDDMLAAGLEDEVRSLVADGYGFDLPAMSGLGYGEWQPYLAGEIERDEVVRRIRRNTRKLVRQQAGWFRADDPRIQWFDLSEDTVDDVADHVARWLEVGALPSEGSVSDRPDSADGEAA